MLKLGDGVRAFARVAIWTGINIDWIKRIGRLQLATIPRETLDSRARIPELADSPIALAVVRLMTRSNLVGCSTGRSAGFAPRKILSTISAARRHKAGKFGP